MAELRLTIPALPPSGNNYVRHVAKVGRDGKAFVKHYVTKEAEAWYWHVAVIAAGRQLLAPAYVVSYVVFVDSLAGADVDNYAKCIFDGIAKAGVIKNDKLITELHGYRRIDRTSPRTIIVVRTGQEELFG